MTQLADLLNSASPPTQNFVTFNGKRPPGRSYPAGAGSPRRWDEQAGYGFSGASLIYIGNGISEFDVIVDLWEPEHWREWNAFAPLLEKMPAGTRMSDMKSIKIGHPLINRSPVKITEVVILDVTQFEQVSAGMWSCRVKCKEWRVAKPALAKVDGIPGTTPKISDLSDDPKIKALVSTKESLERQLNESQKKGLGLP